MIMIFPTLQLVVIVHAVFTFRQIITKKLNMPFNIRLLVLHVSIFFFFLVQSGMVVTMGSILLQTYDPVSRFDKKVQHQFYSISICNKYLILVLQIIFAVVILSLGTPVGDLSNAEARENADSVKTLRFLENRKAMKQFFDRETCTLSTTQSNNKI